MAQIICRVSGGFTGTREAILKDANGHERWFDTMEDAAKEAARLTKKMNGPQRTASFVYRAAARIDD